MSSVPRVTKERNEESITSSNDNVLVDGKDEGKKNLISADETVWLGESQHRRGGIIIKKGDSCYFLFSARIHRLDNV